ncbi:MAG: DUF4147 domain-containing protein [Planctomycetaceae bacterium]|nr:DUF4147 domain-containing protein [Planctomycetaceae bacterium]
MQQDLFAIWQAGVDGVAPDRLVRETVVYDKSANVLCVQDDTIPLENVRNVVVIGAGKASARMSIALEQILLPIFGRGRLTGWVNVPDDCTEPTEAIHLHGARPPGLNEPTQNGVAGTRKMLQRLHDLQPNDLCFCLLSGGGSALLPAPSAEITLAEKCELTRFLSISGATINELNTVRKQLSEIKGGGIRRLCSGKMLFTLILSDVLGDPLDIIASGPTVENTTGPKDALDVLARWNWAKYPQFANIGKYLCKKANQDNPRKLIDDSRHHNIIIGNNAIAVDAAGMEAERRGYSHVMVSATQSEGAAEEVGLHLLNVAKSMGQGGPNCFISGGEPTVRLPDTGKHGKGGRNQQLVLAVLVALLRSRECCEKLRFEILSGGTDGEDGPTDAAGAFLNDIVWQNALRRSDLDPLDFLERCDAYHYFEQIGGLLKTGPTGTNVCDLRVVVVR